MFKRRFVLMDDAAGDAGASGGGVVDPAAGAGDAGDAGDAAVAAAAGAGDAGKGNALQQAQPVQAPAPSIPDKYIVKKEDGTTDIEASSLKLAEAYGSLEKRIGTGDIPPKTAEDYQIAVPDALKDTWKPAEDPLLQEFLKDAHASGMTQKQLDMVMSNYMEIAPALVNATRKLDADACVSELKKEWKTDEQYKAEVGKAYKAAVGYFGSDAEAIIKEYGNDPRIIRGLSKLGGEMKEDKSVQIDGGMSAQSDIDTLITSEAYNNPRHAEHAAVSAKVKTHFEKLAKAAEAAGASMLM